MKNLSIEEIKLFDSYNEVVNQLNDYMSKEGKHDFNIVKDLRKKCNSLFNEIKEKSLYDAYIEYTEC